MQESGIVMQMKEHTMVVEFERSSMCEKCGACERAQQAMLMEVERIGNAKIGDRVQVELPERTLLRAALVAYGIPLIMLILGLVAGYLLPARLGLPGNPDLYAVLLGAVLAGGTFLVLHLTEKKRARSGRYAPKVVSIEAGCPCGCAQQQDQ